MNEPNKERMIPLHIADQAVAACNKEIAELRAQVAELKQQPDALTAYLYAAELAKDDIKKLKAENERLTNCKAEADRLKAELARLRASSFVTAVPVEQYERVVKAGDAMAARLLYQGYPETVQAWEAAKKL